MYMIGIDIGTSGTKTVLFDEMGKSIISSTKEYKMYQPKNGWAEQDPDDWWDATKYTVKKVIEDSKIKSDDIVGIGISGQMHGLVMLNYDGDVIRKSIIWCDQRTSIECNEINEKVGVERLLEITANPALPGFTASKILWVKNNEPENYKKCRHILLPKDYIRYKLTGEFATDVSDASGMQLLDIKNRCWSDEVLEKLDIDKNLLGKVYESVDVTGKINKKASLLTGLKEGTIVVAGAGDNAAAAIGTGVISDGKAFTTIGTSGVVFAHTSKMSIDPKGRVHTFCAAVPNEWHVMGVTQAAGLSLKWFKNNFCMEEISLSKEKDVDTYEIMIEMAEKISIGSENLIYLPYLMGERTPHLDSACRGVFFGLSAMHTKAHMIRSVLEGVSFSLKDCANILEDMGTTFNEMIICGGGGKSKVWRNMLSDIYECKVSTIAQTEGPALGAAILAAVGAKIYPSVNEACEKIIKKENSYNNNYDNGEKYKKYYKIFNKLYLDLENTFKLL